MSVYKRKKSTFWWYLVDKRGGGFVWGSALSKGAEISKKQETPVFLVDDHPMVRAGVAQLLRSSGFTVSGEADSETLSHHALAERPLVIMGLTLGEDNGIDLMRKMCRRGLAVLVYSMHEGAQTVRRALEAGACGYVTKRDEAKALVEAVQTVCSGSRYLSSRTQAALQTSVSFDALNGQQREVYRLLGQGYCNKEIAGLLHISVRTLESYCSRIMDKLGVQGTKELRQLAIREAEADGGGI